MKKLLMVCCLLVSIVSLSKAQGRGPRRTPAEQAKELQASLKLTDDQTAKITAIYTEQSTKMDSVRKAAGDDRQAMMQAMQPMRKVTNEKVMALLTDDQKAAWKKQQEEMRAKMQQGGMGGGGTPPPPSK